MGLYSAGGPAVGWSQGGQVQLVVVGCLGFSREACAQRYPFREVLRRVLVGEKSCLLKETAPGLSFFL